MPHVAFVAFTGIRVQRDELRALGMTLPGLAARRDAIGQLPALGLLTLAGMTPHQWRCTYRESNGDTLQLAEEIIQVRPDIVSVSALTASVEKACNFCTALRDAGIRTVLGGLHATACPQEASRFCTSVAEGDGTSRTAALQAQ